MKRYVIIGNSTAAAGCIEGIRRVDKKGNITVISKEPYHIYSRPLISYLLNGKTDLERMKYRPDDFYQKHQVTPILGEEAIKIDVENKFVLLESGQGVPYDELLVASGSRPFIPPMDGLEKVKNCFTFMTLDDAKEIQKALTSESNVLIVGAGLIGLKCAEGILEQVKKITVVDLSDCVLSSILDIEGSKRVQTHLEEQGIEFYLSDSVEQFDAHSAMLKSGKTIAFDVVVIAVGVRPNIELVAQAGGKVNRGIITDEVLKTSLPHIYAAGDCVESFDITANQNRILALLPNAYLQGEIAGFSMAGKRKEPISLFPMNAMGLMGLHMITAGSYDGKPILIQHSDTYQKLFVKDGVLIGYILIGDLKRAGIYTSLIRDKTPLQDIDFEQMKEHPQLIALSKQKRKQILAQPH